MAKGGGKQVMNSLRRDILPVLFSREQRCLADAASSPEDHPPGLGACVRERSVRRAHCGCVVDPAKWAVKKLELD